MMIKLDWKFLNTERGNFPELYLKCFENKDYLRCKLRLEEIYVIKANAVNPLSAKLIKWSNTLKQIVGKLPTICLSVFDHFSGLALKGLK